MSKLLLALSLTACATTADPAPTARTDDAKTTCVEVMTRNRTCTDDFIPALVDARARADKPAGIREAVAADRAAVIAEAKQEWANDSKDEAIAPHCEAMAAHIETPDFEAAEACLAKDACGEYVACVTPIFEKHLNK